MFSTTLTERDEYYLDLYESYVLEIQKESNRRKKTDEEYEKEKEKLVSMVKCVQTKSFIFTNSKVR